jgi:formylglycine-generating enzyme
LESCFSDHRAITLAAAVIPPLIDRIPQIAPTQESVAREPAMPTETFAPTEIFSPNATDQEGTLQAIIATLQSEQELTQVAQESTTLGIRILTTEARTSTPTPNDRATTAARLTATVGQAFHNSTATAASSTDTPTNRPLITATPPQLTSLSIQLTGFYTLAGAYNYEDGNTAWTPVTHTFEDGITMVLVPKGCFRMGSNSGNADNQPIHEQCFDEPFWIDQTEVTQAQFATLGIGVADNSSFLGENHPVESITWFEARDFCIQRNARLPTEREWEYAGRGPESWVYPWGNGWNEANVMLSPTEEVGSTNDVGSLIAGKSWTGALGMSGNVGEWVSTIYGVDDGDYNFNESGEQKYIYPYIADDGREADIDDITFMRTLRGGSWYLDNSVELSAFFRNWGTPHYRYSNVGFRCARSV